MRKTKSIQYILPLLLIFSLIISCEQAFIGPDPENTPENNFNSMWNVIDERYSYFELKGIDWDSIYDEYSIRIHKELNDQGLFNVLADMLFELHDGHVNLTSDFNRSRNWEWFQNYPNNFNQKIIDHHYLGKDYFVTGPFHNQIIDSVLYVQYSSFSSNYSDKNLDELMERAHGLKGVIIDVRNNGGGKFQNAYKLAACFTNQSTVYANERTKIGTEGDDFSPWVELRVNPRNGKQFKGNVVVLCNRKSYSATTFFAQMMKHIPNATLIGDQTGGGGGVPAFFELPNGWFYRFSVTQTITPHGQHIENGVPADIKVMLDKTDESKGIDTIIEAALNMLTE